MRVAVISDVHCSGRSCERQKEFIAWLDQLQVDSLWMLGDILHYGWDFGEQIQMEFEPVFQAVDRLVERGVELRFVPGNHDFSIGPLVEARWRGIVHGPQICEADGHHFYLGHGDEFDASWGYRILKTILRSEVFRLLMACMGPRLGTGVLRLLAGPAPRVGDSLWPSVQEQVAAQLDGADMAIVGHAHVAWEQQTERGIAIVLGPGVAGARLIEDGEVC